MLGERVGENARLFGRLVEKPCFRIAQEWQCACLTGYEDPFMDRHILVVSGFYDHQQDGEKAAQTLRESGWGRVDVFPANDSNLKALHIGRHGHAKRFFLTVAALPIGFVLGALWAIPTGLIVDKIFAGPIAVGLGVIGIAVATAYVRDHWTPPCDRHSDEAVLVTTEVDYEKRKAVVADLRKTKPDEVDIEDVVETDFLYQKGVH